MSGETVDIRTQDGVADAYLSRPPEEGGITPACCSSWTPSACAPGSRRWSTASRRGGSSCSRRTSSIAPAGRRTWRCPISEDPAQRDPFFARLRPAMAELTPERIVSDGAAYLDYLGRGREPAVRHHRATAWGARRLADRRRLPGARRGARRLPRRRARERGGGQPAPQRRRDLRRALPRTRRQRSEHDP